MFWRKLSDSEEESFRQWARDNWEASKRPSEAWHPVTREEWAKLDAAHARIQYRQSVFADDSREAYKAREPEDDGLSFDEWRQVQQSKKEGQTSDAYEDRSPALEGLSFKQWSELMNPKKESK